MENKKILVFYVGVGDMLDQEVGQYIDRVKKVFLGEEFATRINCEMILLPVREVNSRIECINPKYITDETLIAEHKRLMNDYITALDKFITQKTAND